MKMNTYNGSYFLKIVLRIIMSLILGTIITFALAFLFINILHFKGDVAVELVFTISIISSIVFSTSLIISNQNRILENNKKS